jgi:tripartite-type tricarboxylate transporter receptor subunit TctC
LGWIAVALALLPGLAAAQTLNSGATATWPSKPIRWIVPYPAGGSSDTTARILAAPMAAALHQQVVIENRGGAAGNIGTDAAAKAAPDGYTMLFTTVSLSINETLYPKLPFNPKTDLIPVVQVAVLPNVMVVPAKLPAKTLQEFIALAKAKPGTMNFGSGGTGTSVHVTGELFKLSAGIDIIHVPYKGDGPAMQDLIAGQIQAVFAQLPGAIGHIKGGTLRALGVTTPARSPMLPDVPAIGELLPGFAAQGWYGLFLPSGTPADIVQRLNQETNAVLQQPALRERLAEIGTTPVGGTGAAFAQFLDQDIARWAAVIRAAKITVE